MTLLSEISRVVQNGNCTGCGGCEWLFPEQVEMHLNSEGFLRPVVNAEQKTNNGDVRSFRSMCPGVGVSVSTLPETRSHEVFGAYVSAWQGCATVEDLRHAGSSGGVLSALKSWLLEVDPSRKVIASAADRTNGRRTVPVQISTREEVERAAASRYAPVSNLSALGQTSAADVLVGKPCEVAAVRQHFEGVSPIQGEQPLLLSFFCAGTPSQWATDHLANQLGVNPMEVDTLKYRGGGWPGNFEVTGLDGTHGTMSYQDSWGSNLGRTLQWRCKLCPHGTGDHSDIAVGDYWNSDEKGYPLFEDASGNSVVLARTKRGHDLLLEAARAGVIELSPIDLQTAARVQPLQATRGATLAGRLLGRILAGKRVPNYQGFRLIRRSMGSISASLRAAAGTWRRTLGSHPPDQSVRAVQPPAQGNIT